MTHQYKKLPVTMKMLMQFNVMPRTHDIDGELHAAVSIRVTSCRKDTFITINHHTVLIYNQTWITAWQTGSDHLYTNVHSYIHIIQPYSTIPQVLLHRMPSCQLKQFAEISVQEVIKVVKSLNKTTARRRPATNSGKTFHPCNCSIVQPLACHWTCQVPAICF